MTSPYNSVSIPEDTLQASTSPCPHAAMGQSADDAPGTAEDCNAVGSCCIGAFAHQPTVTVAVSRSPASPPTAVAVALRDAVSSLLLRPPIA